MNDPVSNRDMIRVGVVGVGRGAGFARADLPSLGMKLVALCDTRQEKLESLGRQLDVATYVDFDRFIDHDMDAILLANHFHDHAPFAVKALRAGKHVMSEVSACLTFAQGVELVRTVEKTGLTYMLGENYNLMVCNQEMRRLFREGAIGDFLYGEGEYVHPDPVEIKLGRSFGVDHWRNWIPATYYCTHSLGPIIYITDTRPIKVNGFVVPRDERDPTITNSASRADTAAMIICRMDNGAVVKSLHGQLRGHGDYVRIHGNKGLMENVRLSSSNYACDPFRLRVWREPWEKAADQPMETIYRPDYPFESDRARRTGHHGADYFAYHAFAHAIRTGEPPFFDVYRGVEMSLCGVLAWRSALADSAPQDVPDLRQEAVRQMYENDHWSPAPGTPDAQRAPTSLAGDIVLSPQTVAFANRVWAEQGLVRNV